MTMSLEKVAQAMVAPGRGILAADESSGTIKKRFDSIKAESTADSRRDYREMLFRSTDAMKGYISGVILYDETLRQKAKDGTPLAKVISDAGSLPGIKVDGGTKPLQFCPGEVVTEGLDRLPGAGQGVRRPRRQVRQVARGDRHRRRHPELHLHQGQRHALARYAAICLEGGLVPIVEPEVLMDGAHDIDRCAEVTEWVLKEVFQELYYNRVTLEQIVLKPNMVISGKQSPKQASREEVAEKTVKILKRTVPAAVPGIAFLSGGQSDEDATAHLHLMNAMGNLPWNLTFSYGRALQAAALKSWGGKTENEAAGAKAFSHRAKMNGLAAAGKWSQSLEKAA